MKKLLIILLICTSCSTTVISTNTITDRKGRTEKQAKKDKAAFQISFAVFIVWYVAFITYGE